MQNTNQSSNSTPTRRVGSPSDSGSGSEEVGDAQDEEPSSSKNQLTLEAELDNFRQKWIREIELSANKESSRTCAFNEQTQTEDDEASNGEKARKFFLHGVHAERNGKLQDDTRLMIEFYEIHLERLKTFPVSSLKESVLRAVAVKIHSKVYFKYEWQEYASEMGITDSLHLETIQQSAETKPELPMYITMKTALQRINKNVGDIIRAFLNTKRYDILAFLEPYIKKLLEDVSNTEVKEFMNEQMQVPFVRSGNSNLSSETIELECETVSSMFSTYTEQFENIRTAELDPVFLGKNAAINFNDLQKNSANSNITPKLRSNPSNLSWNKNLPPEIIIPFAPVEENISILIQHTEKDVDVAKQISSKLKGEGFAATTLFDMEMLIRMDPVGALSKIFQEVDFIVPVISEEFLQLIDPTFCGDYDAMSNRTLYNLITNEYQYNGCMNFRVRPVLAPNMKRCIKLTNNCILHLSFQLWKEYGKFVRVLKETKEILRHSALKKMIKAS